MKDERGAGEIGRVQVLGYNNKFNSLFDNWTNFPKKFFRHTSQHDPIHSAVNVNDIGSESESSEKDGSDDRFRIGKKLTF